MNPEDSTEEDGDAPWETKNESNSSNEEKKVTKTDDISKAFDELFSE